MISKLLSRFCCLAEKSNPKFFPLKSVCLTLLVIGSFGAKAQVSNYSYPATTETSTAGTFTYAGITGTGVFPSPVYNLNTPPVEVKFTALEDFNFVFNGKNYTRAWVSPNGYITFGFAPSQGLITPLSSTETYDGAIAVYAASLRNTVNNPANNVQYLVSGMAPNRIFTLQWIAVRAPFTTGVIRMQIVLHESATGATNPGQIELRYGTHATVSGATTIAGQIGLRGEKNHDFNNKTFTTTLSAWPTTPIILDRGTANTNTVNTYFAALAYPQLRFVYSPPACNAPIKVTPTVASITANSASFTWTAPVSAPSNGYDYFVSSTVPTNINQDYPLPAQIPTGSTAAGVTNASVGSLTSSTTYYVYVRSNCGGTPGQWSAAGSFTTACAAQAVPYIQDFESAAVPAPPLCTSVENDPFGGVNWVSSNADLPYGFATKHMKIGHDVSLDNNSTFFTKGLLLTAGVSYRLSYRYGAWTELNWTEQNLIVDLTTSPTAAAMSAPYLANHSPLKGGPYTNVVNFTVPSTGTYYIGFLDYSSANNATTMIDDINVDLTTCFPPTLNATTAITSGSALIAWTPPALAPSEGYDYFLCTAATYQVPNSATLPTGSTSVGITNQSLGGLSPNTQHFFWVRSNCGAGELSSWSLQGTFTTDVGASAPDCIPTGISFQDPNGITNVTFSNVNNTTGLEPNNYGDYAYLIGYVGQSTSTPVTVTYRTGFSYDTTIWVDWNNDGDFDDAGELEGQGVAPANVPGSVIINITPPTAPMQPIGPRRMRIGGMDFGPVTDPCRTGTWQAYEDYTVHVTSPPPALTLSTNTAVICSGLNVPVTITSPIANYNTYTWVPATGVTGTAATGYTLAPTATTTYLLKAYNSVNFHTTSQTVTVTVKQAPGPLAITPATSTVCEGIGPAIALNAAGGAISGVTIFSENFNGSASGWITGNTTCCATNPANNDLAAWGLFPDGYSPFFTNLHSNDNSQFFFTESDASGNNLPPALPVNTNTTLMSPAISLVGYSAASLSFWQFYKGFNGPESGVLAISTTPANPASWTTLGIYGAVTDVGTEANWVNTTINLLSYVGQTVYFRFTYTAQWDWGWGIDNFVITGSGPSAITWAPVTGLYTNPAATIPYNPATTLTATTIYALPATTQTYTATATGLSCTTPSNTVTVTVTPLKPGTLVNPTQAVCTGAAADIVTTGIVGNVLYWQSADDALFTMNVATIASTSTTLTSAMIGAVTGTKYYRAVITASGCGNIYSPVHTITQPTTTYNGTWDNGIPNSSTKAVFTSSYTATANLNACSIEVQGGTLTINPGVTLHVQNAVTVNNAARLVLKNTASLVQVNNVANSGDITVEKSTTMRQYDYTYWSSPVNANTLFNVSPLTMFDKYFYFNPTTYQWTAIAAPGLAIMAPGRGYIIRAPQGFTPTAQAFNTYFGLNLASPSFGGGVPNNGNIVATVGYNSSVPLSLDCIGNPYPSAISADLVMLDPANAAALGAGGTTFYFWTHNTVITANQYTTDDYASYNYSGGVGAGSAADSSPCGGCNNAIPSGFISSGQGFMAKVVANGTVTFKNTMRVSGSNNQFFRMGNGTQELNAIQVLEKNRVWLAIRNDEGAFKQTLVGYIENATNGIESGFDGELAQSANPVSLYSLVDDAKLTIQGRALPFDINDIVPLGYKANVPGTYEIKLSEFDGLFAGDNIEIYLEDRLLNVVYNLKQSVYSFATLAGTFETRFQLRYANTTLATHAPTFDENAVVVYKNDNAVFIETTNVMMKSVQIYDLRGRLIADKQNINDKKASFNLDAAQQILLVQVTSTDNVTITKKIVF